jgi:gamma-tubulin complex component 2
MPGGACVPPLLERWKHKMLLAGKYLNVIRECGIDIMQGPIPQSDQTLSMEEDRYELVANSHIYVFNTL